MEKFKLEIFKKENSEELRYLTLNRDDSSWIISQIFHTLGGREKFKNTDLFFNYLNDSLANKLLFEEEFSSNSLKEIQVKGEIKEDSLVFVVWDLESDIDLFRMETLINYWNYIWYDTSDEAISLFIPCSSKVLLITDHGYIKSNWII